MSDGLQSSLCGEFLTMHQGRPTWICIANANNNRAFLKLTHAETPLFPDWQFSYLVCKNKNNQNQKQQCVMRFLLQKINCNLGWFDCHATMQIELFADNGIFFLLLRLQQWNWQSNSIKILLFKYNTRNDKTSTGLYCVASCPAPVRFVADFPIDWPLDLDLDGPDLIKMLILLVR